jgi:hypothetical protein
MAKLKHLLKTHFIKINEMKIRELLILMAIIAIVGYVLTTLPIQSSSINPLKSISESINSFLNLLRELFFGWAFLCFSK